MTDTHFRIVFEGQLLQGVSLETAKLNLARLFQSEVSAIDALFSGRTVALKQGLIEADAQRYLQALHDAGMQARIEPERVISLNLNKVETVSPYAPPRAEVETPQGYGELQVLSLKGRIGRLRYLAWSFAMLGGLTLGVMIGAIVIGYSKVLGGVIMAVASIAFFATWVSIGVQRLHDMGASGWFMLISPIPYIGSLVPLVLTLAPGKSGSNAYGPPPPANTRAVKVLAGLSLATVVLVLLSVLFTGAGLSSVIKQATNVTSGQNEQSISGEHNSRSAPAQGQSL